MQANSKPREAKEIDVIAYRALGFITILLAALVSSNASAERTRAEFQIYDTSLYAHKPSLSEFGVRDLEVVYSQKTYPNNKATHGLPERFTVEELARKLASTEKMVVLDYEHWPVQGYRHIPGYMRENRAKYRRLLSWYKGAAPNVDFGFFGIVPINNYIASLSPKTSRLFTEWQEDNANMKELADEVDVVFVEGYAYEESYSRWEAALDAHLEQLRRLYTGKIFIFLWPQYFDHAPAAPHLQLRFVPATMWRKQLEAVRQRADGVVIWGGWDFARSRPLDWDPAAPWWVETKRFVGDLRSLAE